MKFSNFILLLILGIAGYAIWNERKPPEVVTVPVYVRPPPTPTPATPPPRTQWTRGELQIVHGKVASNVPRGLVVDCLWVDAPAETRRTGRAFDALRHTNEVAAAADLREYGRLMSLESGSLLPASIIPEPRAVGTVLLVEHPDQERMGAGSPVNVVAAPLGDGVFTMRFVVSQEQPGTWMWQHGRTGLDR